MEYVGVFALGLRGRLCGLDAAEQRQEAPVIGLALGLLIMLAVVLGLMVHAMIWLWFNLEDKEKK